MYLILFIGVALSLFLFFIGSWFIERQIKRKNSLLQFVINFWIGLLLVVSLYAIIKTALVTSMVLVLLVLLLFRSRFVQGASQNPIPLVRFAFIFAIVYVLAFFVQVNFKLDVFTWPLYYLEHIHADDEERFIYSQIISLLHYNGVESISTEAVLKKKFTGVSLYHFPEFWLASLFKTIFNANSDLVLFYFVYPLFKTFTILTIYALYAERLTNKKKVLLGIVIIIGFVIMGLRWIFPPLSVTDLRNIVLLPILILSAKLIHDKRYDTACAMLLIAVVENVLFLPATGLFLLLFFDKLKRRVIFSVIIFFVAYGVFFVLFKEKGIDKYMSLSIQEIVEVVLSDSPMTRLFRVFLLAILSYPFRVLLSFLIINNYPILRKRLWVRDLGYWFFLCFLAYHIAFVLVSNLSVDAIQLKSMGIAIACIAFFFLLEHFIVKGEFLVCLVIMLLLSDYTYPFAVIKNNRTYDISLEEKLHKIGQGKEIIGLFVNENTTLPDQWYLDFYPNQVTEYARANDYRLYLFTYDVTGLRQSIAKLEPSHQRIISKVIQPLFPVTTPILENIQKHDISIVWISKTSKYLPFFQKQKPLHELEDYVVYYIESSSFN